MDVDAIMTAIMTAPDATVAHDHYEKTRGTIHQYKAADLLLEHWGVAVDTRGLGQILASR